MTRFPYVYTPDEYIDCGDLGEHPITFTALVDREPGRFGSDRYSVTIMRAVVKMKLNGQVIEVDCTSRFKNHQKWENEIYKDYMSASERDYDGDTSA